MIYHKTPLTDAYLIDIEKLGDARGFFARLFCHEEFAANGLDSHFVQANNSLSTEAYTLRGLHYQLHPKAENKLVRCIQGALYDVIVDLRPESTTFGKSFGAILSAENRQMMYVPKGFAHGFITLKPNSEIFYMVSESYSKELERGLRWNDPYFNIQWPATPVIISQRDSSHPDFNATQHINEFCGVN